jgi:DNA modification methylase
MKYKSGRYKYGNPHEEIAGDNRYPSELIPKFKEKAKKSVVCFCRWDNLCEVEKPKSFIVWAKNNWSAGDLENAFGRMWEGILFYPLSGHKFNKRLPDLIDFSRIPPTRIHHPTQKPTQLIDWLLRGISNKGDIVLDPFMGSGTTSVVCEKLNRKWIGIEISEKYCEIAAKRIENETKQLKLWN